MQRHLGLSYQRAPVTLLTGYLGAGKTTLLNHILNGDHGERIAVLVNEFGEVSIDDKLIVRGDDEVIEMANGCMCCIVKDDTLEALYSMNERRHGRAGTPIAFDRVVLEASGVANPIPIIRMFLEDDRIAQGYVLDGVVALVDGVHIEEQFVRTLEAKEQVACADVVVLNKTDLMTQSDIEERLRWLRAINPRARIISSEHANIDLGDILSIGGFSSPEVVIDEDHDVHMHDPEVSSVVLRSSRPLVKDVFLQWVSEYLIMRANDLYRYKGIVALDGQARKMVIQGVHAYFDMSEGEPWHIDEAHESVLVLIGKGIDRDEYLQSFRQCQRV